MATSGKEADDKPLVFLSHSSKDREVVAELRKVILEALNEQVSVFCSTRATAIPSGIDWFSEVIKKLEEAKVLIILLTSNSEQSTWVGFEAGYFWKKGNGGNIHVLSHPDTAIPSPINSIQAKLITDTEQVDDFFAQLCAALDLPPQRQFATRSISLLAEQIKRSATPRTLWRFEELLDTAGWDQVFIGDTVAWICVEDVTYQIVDINAEPEEIEESWTRGFPDNTTRKSIVQLKVEGVVFQEIYFVSLDGGRYFVPMPDVRDESIAGGDVEYFWDRSSLSYKIGKKIARFYLNHTFDSFADKQGITIIDSHKDEG